MSALYRASVLTALIFTAQWTKAQETLDLETIEVSAQKAPSEFNFTSSEVIEEEELKAAPASSVAASLSKVNGLYFAQNGGPGSTTSFFMRGTESRHVAFLYDGAKLNDPSGPTRQFDAAYLFAPDIESIEVFKGPQPVLFGSDSIGGLVYLHSRKGANIPKVRFNLGGGSFGTRHLYLGQDWSSRKQRGSLTVGSFHSDGISNLNRKRYGYIRRNPTDTFMATSSSRHAWTKKLKSDLLLKFIKGRSLLDDESSFENGHDLSRSEQYLFQQNTEMALRKQAKLFVRTSHNRHNRMVNLLSTGDTFYQGGLTQAEVYMKLRRGTDQLLVGTSTEHETAEEKNLDRSFDLQSIYLQVLKGLKNWRLQSGLREDFHQRYGRFTSFSSGLSYLRNRYTTRLQYSQGYKAPSIYQLHGFFGGNKDLVPERNNSWELSLRKEERWGDWELAAFENHLSHLITWVNDGSISGVNINQGNFIVRGVELGSNVLLTDSLTLRPAFTHQKFLANASPVLRRPQNMASLQLSYFPLEKLELYGQLKWVGSRRDTDFNDTVKINSYEVLNLGARAGIRPGHELGVHLLNAMNRDYEDIYGFSVMPRALMADWKVEI